jgi:DNA-binding transcriptional MerR regulator
VRGSIFTESDPGLTTGDLARLTGIPQQTLISWDRSGVLRARRPRRRSSSRAPRRYDEAGLAAALFASNASQMGFRGDSLGQIVRLVQSGDRTRLERAGIFTYRTFPGMMKHVFSPDLSTDDDRRYVAHLRDQGALLEGPTSLLTIREEFFRQAQTLIRMPELRSFKPWEERK